MKKHFSLTSIGFKSQSATLKLMLCLRLRAYDPVACRPFVDFQRSKARGEMFHVYAKKNGPKITLDYKLQTFPKQKATGTFPRLVNTANTPAKAVKFFSPKNSDKNPCHTRYVCESSPVSVTSPGKGDHGHYCSFSLLQKIIKSKHAKTTVNISKDKFISLA